MGGLEELLWGLPGGRWRTGAAIGVTAIAGIAVVVFIVASTRRGRLKSPWHLRRQKAPLNREEWKRCFTPEGKLVDGGLMLLKKIRSGGIDPSIRAEVWPYLLGVYNLDCSDDERIAISTKNRDEYLKLRKHCLQKSAFRNEDKQADKFAGDNQGESPAIDGNEEQFMNAISEVVDPELNAHQLMEEPASGANKSPSEASTVQNSYSKEENEDAANYKSSKILLSEGSSSPISFHEMEEKDVAEQSTDIPSEVVCPANEPSGAENGDPDLRGQKQLVQSSPEDEINVVKTALKVNSEEDANDRSSKNLPADGSSASISFQEEEQGKMNEMSKSEVRSLKEVPSTEELESILTYAIVEGKTGSDYDPITTGSRKGSARTVEDFPTWQRIIRLDAIRANDEWVPYARSQVAVSLDKAIEAAKSVNLVDYEHLEPHRIYHAARLVAVLEAYAVYDPEIGYCQGMSDLLAPLLAVLEEDHEAFWCFAGFMRKARHNFRLDEVGIRRQLNMVSKIIKFKDHHLYRHLEDLQAEDCFFVYRMVVVMFRRELTFEQTLYLWEVMWADQAANRVGIGKSAWGNLRMGPPPTDDLLLFAIAASVLQKRKLIIEKYVSMDEIIRECNSMSGNLDIWKLLDDAHDLVVTLHDRIQ